MSKDKKEGVGSLWILLVIVFATWLGSGFAVNYFSGEGALFGDRGTFGDMFGAVNSLFSGLAFASLVFTIFLQRKELGLQRNELELTRNELTGQKEQLKAQNDVMKIQNFENTFFQLLRLMNDIITSTDIQGRVSGVTKGRDCYKFFYKIYKDKYTLIPESSMSECERINKAYDDFYESWQSDVGHYFRTLYNVLKFVNESNIENKRFYTNLIRSQLSSQELLLLFYNSLSINGQNKMKPLIEKYCILKAMPVELLVNKEEHFKLYAKSAYQ